MIGSSTQKTNSTTQSQPWQPAQPGLNSILSASQNWLANAPNYKYFNQPSSAATLDPSQTKAIGGIENLASNGGPQVTQNATNYTNDVLGGKYLNAGNPAQSALDAAITNATLPGLNASFSAAGRTGSGLNQYNVAAGLGQALAQPHYQNYQNERGIQQNAAAEAIPLANQEYKNFQNMYNAGGMTQQQQQEQLDAALKSWQFNQNAPLTVAQGAAGLTVPIAGLGGTSNTNSTTQQSANPFTSGLGMLGTLFSPGASGTSLGGNIASGLGKLMLL